jgi:hypothetical protein
MAVITMLNKKRFMVISPFRKWFSVCLINVGGTSCTSRYGSGEENLTSSAQVK